MKRVLLTTAAVALVAGLSAAGALANPITFFGEDGNLTGSVPMTLHPHSDAAQASFFSNLTGIGVDGLDSVASGTTVVPVDFGNGVTATLTGGTIISLPDTGRFAISDPNYYSTDSASFGITFSNPIAAFGFYATDVGDYGGQLTATLTDIHGAQTPLTVPNAISNGGAQPENGSVLYWGFYDTSDTYTSVTFGDTSASDYFAFDNFSVGTLQQVTPTPTPEPGTLLLIGSGLVTLAGLRRRRRKKS